MNEDKIRYGAAIEIPKPVNRLVQKLAGYALAIGLGLVLAAIACWGLVK